MTKECCHSSLTCFLFVCSRTDIFDIASKDYGQVKGVQVTRGSGSSWHLKQVRGY